jgi:hypothetical protein
MAEESKDDRVRSCLSTLGAYRDTTEQYTRANPASVKRRRKKKVLQRRKKAVQKNGAPALFSYCRSSVREFEQITQQITEQTSTYRPVYILPISLNENFRWWK